jgi:hypothetical protein
VHLVHPTLAALLGEARFVSPESACVPLRTS